MMRQRIVMVVCLLLFVGGMGTTLSGCSSQSSMTKEEEANFKGGPMPPGFLEQSSAQNPPAPTQNSPR